MKTSGNKKTAKKHTPAALRARILKDGRQSLYLDIYIRGKRCYEPLKLFLVQETDEKSTKKNAATLKKAESICKKRNKELQAMFNVSKRSKAILANEYTECMTISKWMQRFYGIQESKGIKDLHSIRVTQALLSEFRPNALLQDVDRDFCVDFMAFLQSHKKKGGGTYSSKTAFNIIGLFSTALTTAVKLGKLKANPYLTLASCDKIKVKETLREYLTVEELKRLVDAPCSNERVKQVFLFACNCGLRIGDIEALTWNDVVKDDRGWGLSVVMAKTSRPVYIPLGEQALRWMPKGGRHDADEKVFDGLPSNLRINIMLKEWAKSAGITKNVTMHVARHTYATMLLTLGADLYTVSKLLGHTSVKHTQRYAKIINKKKDDAVHLIDQMFEQNK